MSRTEQAAVPDHLAGQRLDAVAAQLFPMYSRGRLKSWIESGDLRVNGAVPEKARQPVAAGDQLDLTVDEQPLAGNDKPQAIPLDVVYEDDDIAVINKPPGLTVHPGAGQADSTMQNALLHRFPQTDLLPRAGLVHRLDKDTSGLLIVGLTLEAYTRLVSDMAAREINREYDAVVNGAVTAGGTVDMPIGRDPRNRLKMAVVSEGRPAVTHYRVSERFTHHTLLRVKLETGRTHQIRVHMAQILHPIVGDAVYGGKVTRGRNIGEDLRKALNGFPRQALHARELRLEHPITGEELHFSAEAPPDMQRLLDRLRAAQA
ncbi:23S rRNA pseudouridine(1911/1915/1917) synthase RluD [Nevskia sp.]|uniref:23S rRNA pseudouridine(1911/1915/1917) synthase RluD n=1 Tax=Nevskia sp. TaxID=1929292 RepID=UPI0025EBA2D6|nr:23S rRNA pseudouridine(1911/1915/1917) synthase RluD [Nevskia sp.]HET7796302.1 23S rRNA pseudouridine(1911/1915/1917) synthase RluD [Nevskia sp.]